MQIALALFFLWKQVGYSVISGVVVMLLLLPINFFITMQTRKYQVCQNVFERLLIPIFSSSKCPSKTSESNVSTRC
jgi:hypothetical protein